MGAPKAKVNPARRRYVKNDGPRVFRVLRLVGGRRRLFWVTDDGITVPKHETELRR